MKKIFLFLLMILLSPAFAQDAAIDQSFAPNNPYEEVTAMARYSNGSILYAAKYTDNQFNEYCYLRKITSTGAVDPSFINSTNYGDIKCIVIQNDKIFIAAGNIYKLNSNGSPDTSFIYPVAANMNPVNVIAIQPVTNKIIVGVGAISSVGERLYRLNANGTVDTTFGTSGNGVYQGGWAWTTSVNDIETYSNGDLLIVGNFPSYDSQTRSGVVKININGSPYSTTFPSFVNNEAKDAVIQPDGKIVVVGGDNTATSIKQIVRFNANGTLDTGFTGPSAPTSGIHQIKVIQLQADGKIVIGGDFTQLNGLYRRSFARLLSTGAVDTCFDPVNGLSNTTTQGIGTSSSIIVQPDGKIVTGGKFTYYNGTARSSIVRVQGITQVDAVNDTATAAPGTEAIANILANDTFNGTTATLATVTYTPLTSSPALSFTTAGKILVAANAAPGTYSVNYQICRKSTNCNCDTATVTVTVTNPQPQIIANDDTATIDYPLTDTIVLNALTNDTYNGNLATTSNVSFAIDTSSSEYIYIDIASGNVYIAANAPAGTHTFTYIIKDLNNPANNDTATVTIIINEPAPASSTRANNTIVHIDQQSTGQTIITGNFSSYNDITANKIARLNSNLTYDWNFYSTGPATGSAIVNFAIDADDSILAVGDFSQFNGTNIGRGIVKLAFNGDLDTYSFNSGTGVEILSAPTNIAAIYGLDIQSDGKILIGGYFDTYNGVSRNGIVRLNANGTIDYSFITGTGFTNFNGPSYGPGDIVVQPDGKILIAGSFSNYNGSTMNKIGRLNANGTIDTSFSSGSGITGLGSDNRHGQKFLLQPDGKIILYGKFDGYNGTSKSCIVRLNVNGSIDTSFIATGATGGNSVGPFINTVSLQPDGKYIIGGNFTSFNGTAVKRLIRLNSDGSLDSSFSTGTGPNDVVWDLFRQSNGKILVGGAFTVFNTTTAGRITRIAPTAPGVEARGLQIWDNDPELEMTASTDSFLNSNEVSIYPNPSAGLFNLALNGHDGTQFDVTVHNSLGQLVYKGKAMAGNVSQIDLQGLQQGNYFIQLQSSNTTINKIITKK